MNAPQNNEMSFVDLVRILMENKRIAMIVFALVLLAGAAITVLATPVYRAEVVLAAASQNNSAGAGAASLLSRFSGVAGLGSLSRFAQRDQVFQGMATLRSQKFTREYIAEKQLLPVLFADKWNAADEEWTVDSPEDVPTLADGYDRFDEIRSVEQDDETGLITLAVEWTDPDLAASWANDLVFRLNERLRANAITEADETIEFLNKEVEKTRIVQLQQAIYFMLEEQINVRTMANIRQEFAFKVISPAIAPEPDRYFYPNALLIMGVAIFLGAFLGMLSAVLVHGLRVVRQEL